MHLTTNDIALISLIISFVNITITLYNWHYRRPRLEFYPTQNMLNGFKASSPEEYLYYKSHCIAFYYVKIANLSDLPCTISECTLSVDGYAESISSLRVNIRESYEVNDTYSISNRMCLSLPLTIPPLGYAEGFIVFPFGPSYKEDILHVEFTAKTARKDFMIYDTIKRYSSFCADGVEIFE